MGENNSRKVPEWVRFLLAMLIPLIMGFVAYGALNERVAHLRLDVDKTAIELETRVQWGVEQMLARDEDLVEIKVSLAQIQVQQQEVQKDLAEIRTVLMRIQDKLDEGR